MEADSTARSAGARRYSWTRLTRRWMMQGGLPGEEIEGQIERIKTNIQRVEGNEVEGEEAAQVLRESREALDGIREHVSNLTEEITTMGECREDVPYAALRPVMR